MLHAGNGRFEVASVPDPTPGPDELLVRVASCGICGSDLKAAAGMPAGTILGHEFCGEVVAAGRDVPAGWSVGQLVASLPLRSCGRCRWCLSGEAAHCETVDYLGLGSAPGAFAEYVKVSPALSVRLPSELGRAGALVEPLAVGLHAVTASALQPGDGVLVLGGGAVGAAVTTWARRLGAGRVVVSDPAAERREMAGGWGASAAHDPGDRPLEETFDVVFECVGATGMVQTAIDRAGVKGRVVVAGVCTKPDQFQPIVGLMKEVDLRFVVFYTLQEFVQSARAVAAGEINTDQLITADIGFDRFDETFSGLVDGGLRGKYLLRP